MITLQEKYQQLLSSAKTQKKTTWGKSTPAAPETGLTSDIVNMILFEAVTSRASDIHIEPQKDHIRVRYRIDGKLYDVLKVVEGPEVHLLARFKVISNIPTDSVSSRKAWDSRFSLPVMGQEFDFRVATFP